MPSSPTITSFPVFAPRTLITSADHNTNFSNFRGHMIPIDPNTATASDSTYDLGSTEYAWNNLYVNNIVYGTLSSKPILWSKYSKTYSDIQGATVTNYSELFESPAKGTIEKIVFHQTAAFIGGSLTDVDLMVGIESETDRYIYAIDVFNTSTTELIMDSFDVPDFNTVTSIRLYATATGSNLDSLSAGAVDIHILRGQLY